MVFLYVDAGVFRGRMRQNSGCLGIANVHVERKFYGGIPISPAQIIAAKCVLLPATTATS